MNLNDALLSVWSGNSIVFLGSGFSRGAKNSRFSEFKTSDLLAKHFASLVGGPIDDDLGEAAEYFLEQRGGFALIDEIKAEFTAKTVQDFHKIVASAPWKRVYTTNYDNVYETSLSKNKLHHSVTLKLDPYQVSAEGLQIVHLNGFVGDLSYDDINTTLKLTDTSYVTSSVTDSPWAITFRNDLRVSDSVFFLGYSLFDLDIKRILASDPELIKKTFFVLGNTFTEKLRQRAGRFGELLTMNIAEFADELLKSESLAPKIKPFRYESLSQIRPEPESEAAKDQDIIDLFELGLTSDQLVQQSIKNSGRYYLERSAINKVLSALESDTSSLVITSALGNGKSMLLRGLAYRAIENGYTVYSANEPSKHASIEFERIGTRETKTLLLVDDYAQWMTELRAFALVRKPNTKIILTARDTSHDVLFTKLEEILGLPSVPEYSIDKLDKTEVDWFSEILDLYGLWGDCAGLNPFEKLKLIQIDCESEIHGILLKQLKSGEIGRRLRDLINSSYSYVDVISSVFILAILRIGDPRIETLYDIWGSELISSSTFRNDPVVRSLVDFERWVVRARSAVIAEYVIQELLAADIVPTLLKLVAVFDAGSRGGIYFYKKAFEEMMRYGTLQRLLPEKGRLAAAVRFYEGVKEFPSARNNPLFWFQFAIACVTLDDIDRAGKYFDTAYALANRQKFDTFQIDNHYARFLLVEASQKTMPKADALRNFRTARDIINRQLQMDRLHYPYRVAISYQSFIDQNLKSMDEDNILEIVKAAENVNSHIAILSDHLKRHRYVKDCSRAMKYVLGKCSKS